MRIEWTIKAGNDREAGIVLKILAAKKYSYWNL